MVARLTIDLRVIFTPFGIPVVPLVYNIQAKSPETTDNLSKVPISSLSKSEIFKRIVSFASDLTRS